MFNFIPGRNWTVNKTFRARNTWKPALTISVGFLQPFSRRKTANPSTRRTLVVNDSTHGNHSDRNSSENKPIIRYKVGVVCTWSKTKIFSHYKRCTSIDLYSSPMVNYIFFSESRMQSVCRLFYCNTVFDDGIGRLNFWRSVVFLFCDEFPVVRCFNIYRGRTSLISARIIFCNRVSADHAA